jgi:AraC family transcriptional regulator
MEFTLKAPRLVDGAAMRVAGLEGHYTREQTGEIPRQWDRFNPQWVSSPLRTPDDVTYGVIFASTPMRYVCGVVVSDEAQVPEGWVAVDLPAQSFAVFAETGGVEGLRATWPAIYQQWLPTSGYKQVAGPMLERYDDRWADAGEFEIWVPVQSKG